MTSRALSRPAARATLCDRGPLSLGKCSPHRRLALIKQLAAQVAISLTNARLDVARIAAQAADRARTRFLMNMSHELRTALNAILATFTMRLPTRSHSTQSI